jgi:hypothetical protein
MFLDVLIVQSSLCNSGIILCSTRQSCSSQVEMKCQDTDLGTSKATGCLVSASDLQAPIHRHSKNMMQDFANFASKSVKSRPLAVASGSQRFAQVRNLRHDGKSPHVVRRSGRRGPNINVLVHPYRTHSFRSILCES